MRKIRYTYAKDVAAFGAAPIEVPDSVAEVLVEQRRRAIYADDVCESCPVGNCDLCPIQ